jgi:hypothetical protein
LLSTFVAPVPGIGVTPPAFGVISQPWPSGAIAISSSLSATDWSAATLIVAPLCVNSAPGLSLSDDGTSSPGARFGGAGSVLPSAPDTSLESSHIAECPGTFTW